MRVTSNLEFDELGAQGVILEQPTDQWVAHAEDQLDGLDRFEQPDHSWHDAEDPRVRTGGREFRGRGSK